MLMRCSAITDPIHDMLFKDLAIFANYVSTREFSGTVIWNADYGNVIDAGMATNKIFKL